MGACELCGNEMQSAESCIEHEIVVQNDGRIDVIDAPKHSAWGSLMVQGQCNDCGVKPGGIHHPRCDVARQPDGSQVLIDSVEYRTDDQSYPGHNRLEQPVDGKSESYQFRAHPDVDFRGVSTHLSLDHELETDKHTIEVCCYIDDDKIDEVLDDLRLDDWDIDDNKRHDQPHQVWFTTEVA